jgi:phage anti-repressor protein
MTNVISITSAQQNQDLSDILPIEKQSFGDEEINAIDARKLHEFLEVKEHFNEWVRRYVEKYDFVVNSDFCRSFCIATNGRKMETYVLSIDMAKELCMISNVPKGKQARRYFIQCEKIAMQKEDKPDIGYLTKEAKAGVEMAGLFGVKGNQALLAANKAVKNFYGVDCMASLGISGLISEEKIQYFTPTVLGKQIGISAKKFNEALRDAGMQTDRRDHKNRLVWSVTDLGKQHCQMLDTNKKHSDGTPILQIKWAESVLDLIDKAA